MVQLHDDVKRALESFMHGRNFHGYGCSNLRDAAEHLLSDIAPYIKTALGNCTVNSDIEQCEYINNENPMLRLSVVRSGETVNVYLFFRPRLVKKAGGRSNNYISCRYDYWQAIRRSEADTNRSAIVLLLTDIPAFPLENGVKGNRQCDYTNFALNHGRTVSPGTLRWLGNETAKTNRTSPVKIQGSYALNWKFMDGTPINADIIPKKNNPYFFYLMTEVNAPKSNPQNLK